MRRVAVIGLGLMGGSIGLAAKARRLSWEVVGFTRTPARGREALRLGAVDRLCKTPSEAVAGADLVVFCAPVKTIPDLVRACRPALSAGQVLTDVGSTRAFLDQEIPRLLRGSGAVFVGSHPVAGSEQQGIGAARGDLYHGATVLITPTRGASAKAIARVTHFWRALGGRVVQMDSRRHDQILARTSHLPHMVASLLALTVGRQPNRAAMGAYCGGGFADTSRVAEGSPEVWLDIVRTNRSNLADELRAYRKQLDRLVAMLDKGNFIGITRALEEGRAARRALMDSNREMKAKTK